MDWLKGNSVGNIFAYVCLIVGCGMVAASSLKQKMYKHVILRKFGLIEHGTLTILDQNGNILLSRIGTKNTKPNVVIKIETNDEDFFATLTANGEVGLGDMYSQGKWTCNDLMAVFDILNANTHILRPNKTFQPSPLMSSATDTKYIQSHYDVGNDFFETFLDTDVMAYTCAMWYDNTCSLEAAQKHKVDMIIRKLEVKDTDTILDIGCGWGKIGNYIKQKTNAKVHGVSISAEQCKYLREYQLLDEVHECHVNDIPENLQYDKIFIIGSLEHIRAINYAKYMSKLDRLLKPGGRIVIHTMVINPDHLDEASESMMNKGESVTFVSTRIFPGGQITKYEWMMNAATRHNNFKLVHFEGLGGQNYGKTLCEWRKRLLENRDVILKLGYSDDIIRAYEYYFIALESNFKVGNLYIGQYIFDKVDDLYQCSNAFITY